MPLWGTTTANESKPKWLTDAEKENCVATPAGWVLTHPDGTKEILVAIRGLSTRLAGATVSKVAFASGAYVGLTTKSVKLTFNEAVAVTGNPTMVVTGDLAGDIVATYASSNAAGNVLTFEFAVPAAANELSVAAQTITLAGGTILDVEGGAASSLAVAADVALAAGTKTTTVAP